MNLERIRNWRRRFPLGTRLLVFGIVSILILLVFATFLNYKRRQKRREEFVAKRALPEEFDQLIKHFEARVLRRVRTEHGLPLDDPNCDPNSFPLSPHIARLSDQAKKHLYALALKRRQIERGLPLEDPNADPNNLALPPKRREVKAGSVKGPDE